MLVVQSLHVVPSTARLQLTSKKDQCAFIAFLQFLAQRTWVLNFMQGFRELVTVGFLTQPDSQHRDFPKAGSHLVLPSIPSLQQFPKTDRTEIREESFLTNVRLMFVRLISLKQWEL